MGHITVKWVHIENLSDQHNYGLVQKEMGRRVKVISLEEHSVKR